MKISIITVCYNSEKTIKDTLESVLSQTYTNYEYLIIDGRSTDQTLNIIKEYEKKFKGRLKYTSEKDKGLFDAMNKGIKKSTGDIIGIINSDDVLSHETVFEKVVKSIKDVDGVYSNLLMLNESLQRPNRLFKSKVVSKYFGWHMPHPTLYLKKEVYEKYGNFDLNFRVSADLDFMLRIIKNNVNLKYINDYFVYMRAGGASTKGLKGYYNNFKESYKVLKKNKVLLPLITNIKRTLVMYHQRFAVNNKKEIKRALSVKKVKPKLIQINTVCNGSIGKIMGDIGRKANSEGFETLIIYARRKGFQDLKCIKVGGFFSFWFHVFITTIFDLNGHGSYFKTKKIVRILKEENPDIIQLHNIHGYYLNYKVLFTYLKNEFNGKLFWTFHDCYSFTGHCPHFVAVNCNRWKEQCFNCPNKKKYPVSLFYDRSKKNYMEKKKLFASIPNLTIITPSDWLKNLVKQSYFSKYPIITILNWIDYKIFKPREDKKVLSKYNILNNKKIILGVANIWDERKGLRVFKELAEKISDEYRIVLVGLNKIQLKKLKPKMIGIKRTENQEELAVIYTKACIFINPSKEETFSLTTLEAIACETPAIVLGTSAVKELINAENGEVLKEETLENYLKAIQKLENKKIERTKMKKYFEKYDKEMQVSKYLQIYEKK